MTKSFLFSLLTLLFLTACGTDPKAANTARGDARTAATATETARGATAVPREDLLAGLDDAVAAENRRELAARGR